jgi:hypothetical protein
MFDPAWARAIGSIESGGRYDTLGPVTGSGDRAYGKYQVMGSNVGPWTKQHLGREMTPEEFLNDPTAQDRVFEKQFGGTADKYGSPQEAASIWFTGRPMAQGANARDILGTTGSGYVSKFNKALGLRAISAAMGENPSEGDSQVMAYADTNSPTPTPPPDNGFLGQLARYGATQANGGYTLADALGNAGVAMMANDNARGASALSANLAATQKQANKQPEWQYDAKSGTFFRTNAQGQLERQKNPDFNDEAKAPKINDKVLKNLSDTTEKYGAISQISDEGAKVLDDLQSGKLDLGALRNAENSGRNMIGASNEQSLAYARYKQFIQKLADTELLKAKGVQTEGDAYRVMQEIGAGGANFDTQAAKDSITKLLLRNKDAVTGHGRSILDAYKGTYGEDHAGLKPFTDQFDSFGKVYDNIDNQLAKYKQPASTPSVAAPAAGGFRVIKGPH